MFFFKDVLSMRSSGNTRLSKFGRDKARELKPLAQVAKRFEREPDSPDNRRGVWEGRRKMPPTTGRWTPDDRSQGEQYAEFRSVQAGRGRGVVVRTRLALAQVGLGGEYHSDESGTHRREVM